MIPITGYRNDKGIILLPSALGRFMRLTTIFLLLVTLRVSANDYIGNSARTEKNFPLTDIFKSINQQNDFFSGKEITYFKPQLAPLTVVVSETPPKEIRGIVTNKDGEPLQNVSVSVVGTQIGAVTDANGRFSLSVSLDRNIVLEISSVGFETKRINVGKQTEINITLDDVVAGMEEIVIGYGRIRKKDLTGSVAQVKAADLKAFAAANPLLTLSGRAAGVQVKQVSGQPGAELFIRIRGSNSIRGSNDPLYVIDGIPTDYPYVLNNGDIESMEILKDASSTAIYGSRGANGVVIITTKGGSAGRTKIDLESRYTSQQLRKKIDLMDAQEYTSFYNQLAANSGMAPFYTAEMIKGYGKGTDWQDLVFRKAPMQDHTLTISGGNAKTRFSLAGSLFDQRGIIENSSFKRYSARMNFRHEVNNWMDVEFSSIASRSDQSLQSSAGARLGGSLIAATITAPPIFEPYDSTGNPTIFSQTYPFPSSAMGNPLLYTKLTQGGTVKNDVNTTGKLSFKIIEGLRLNVQGGYITRDIRNDSYQSIEYNRRGNASVSTSSYTSTLSENTLEYRRVFNRKHSFNVLAGQTYQNFITKGLSGSATDMLSDITNSYNLASSRTPGIPASSYNKSVLLSYLGRINYSYNDMVLLTGSLRADGASKYSPGEKWGYFPSFALALKIKEMALQNVDAISDLKLRGSWGKTGSQAINAYATMNLLQAGATIFGSDTRTVTLAPGNSLPFKLKWESTAQLDFGIDASFLEGRYRFVADFYRKVTTNLLSIVSLPTSTGYASSLQNIGAMENKGVEFSIEANLIKNRAVNWNVSGNISFNRNKIKELYGGKDIITGNFNFGGAQFIDDIVVLRQGQPLGMFYGYEENGYAQGAHGALSVVTYKDRNNDGVINIEDKIKIGDPNPDFIYGFSSFLTYKAFSLSAYFQGTYGNDIANLSALTLYEVPYWVNTLKEMPQNLATSNNPNAKYPQPEQRNLGLLFSKRFVEKGSYLRLQHIELGYSLQKGPRSAYIFIGGDNLLTFTKYSWWDPEVNATGVDIVQGVDYNTYPRTKSYTFGVRLSL